MIDAPRVLIHVQHLMGIGHLRRSMILAGALTRCGARVCVATGGMSVPGMAQDAARQGIDLVQLEPGRAKDLTYKVMLDSNDEPVGEAWFASRSTQLAALAHSFRPHVLITETYPFGRRRLADEVIGLINAVRQVRPGVRVLASIRDILEGFSDPGPRCDTVLEVVKQHYDGILVHGEELLTPLCATFVEAARLVVPIHYVGYAAQADAAEMGHHELAGSNALARKDRNGVVVSTGGGAVGQELVEAALAARGHSKQCERMPWRVLIGHNASQEDFERWQARAPQDVTVERNRPDFRELLRRASVSVSQVGYNTVVDVLMAEVPAVLVPFRSESQKEQGIRARLLGDAGRAVALAPGNLTPESLARAIDTAVATTVAPLVFSMNGADRAAAVVLSQFGVSEGVI
jgi:predicted glycosyltransferase